jgi:phosphonate transport system substrate-binding protein
VGVCAKNLGKFAYLRRHDNVFNAVANGWFDAGALKESTFNKRNKKDPKELRILHSFPNTTKPWLVRSGLDDRIYNALKSALLEMNDQSAFKKLKIKGFFSAQHEEYKIIEEAIFKVDEFSKCGSSNNLPKE